ncbi:MAG: hypothetical protein HPY65_19015 [Syntrophaceae bacterium]|nr:hypothetical protein [Syntrophaceae bacterium]
MKQKKSFKKRCQETSPASAAYQRLCGGYRHWFLEPLRGGSGGSQRAGDAGVYSGSKALLDGETRDSGTVLRRHRARLGAPKAIQATAHKMARWIYLMRKHGISYVDIGQDYYEQRHRTRVIQNLKRKAHSLAFELISMQAVTMQS